MIIILSIV